MELVKISTVFATAPPDGQSRVGADVKHRLARLVCVISIDGRGVVNVQVNLRADGRLAVAADEIDLIGAGAAEVGRLQGGSFQ